jgi:hypothetical protein
MVFSFAERFAGMVPRRAASRILPLEESFAAGFEVLNPPLFRAFFRQ